MNGSDPEKAKNVIQEKKEKSANKQSYTLKDHSTATLISHMHKSRDFVEFSLPAVEMLLPVPTTRNLPCAFSRRCRALRALASGGAAP
jgi:hypothetical protein